MNTQQRQHALSVSISKHEQDQGQEHESLGLDLNVDLGFKGKKKDSGFSLIELIVVVLIIGTISAVGIPVYQGVQASAIESSIKSDLRNSSMQLEEYKMRHGTYPRWRDVGEHMTISKDNYGYNTGNFLYCENGESYGIFVFAPNGDRHQQSSTYGYTQDNTVSSTSTFACSAMGVTENQRPAWLRHDGEWRV